MIPRLPRGLAVLLLVPLAACSAVSSAPAVPSASLVNAHASGSSAQRLAVQRRSSPVGKITHVVFIVQENRTLDNLFGGPRPFPGADAASFGQTSNGKTVPLQQIEFFPSLPVNNNHRQWLTACNAPGSVPPFPVGQPSPCLMNGFNKNQSLLQGDIYSFVDYAETKPYWQIASTYTLADHFFTSHNSESYTGHQYIFSAQSGNVVDTPVLPGGLPYITPWGCDSPKGTVTHYLNPVTGQESLSQIFPCFNYLSLADAADLQQKSWRMYIWEKVININALDVNKSIRYGPFWKDQTRFRTPETAILKDVSGPLGLADITWVLPGPTNSDHPGTPSLYGPQWVSNVIDAIGESPYWSSTAIFVFWDDWGGFYDHVPPYVVRDQAGPGFRVPLLVVSPYAKPGYVSKPNIEFGTLLNFTEAVFGLSPLGGVDTSPYIGSYADLFNFSAPPRRFVPIPTTVSRDFFEHLDEGRVLEMSPGTSGFWEGANGQERLSP
jgi:phospholipase C